MTAENGKKFLVSTDSSGIVATPGKWKDVWEPAFDFDNFGGFEMLGWRSPFSIWTNFLLWQADKKGCEVVGIHGRTGGIHDSHRIKDRVKMRSINSIIISTPEMIARYGGRVPYILVHGPELRFDGNWQALQDHRINMIYVENHTSRGAVGGATEMARMLKSRGVNSGVMFDLFHRIYAYDGLSNLPKTWAESMSDLQDLTKQQDYDGNPIPVGLHLSLGTNEGDSIPIDGVTIDMWKKLREILLIGEGNIQIVIENQQTFPDTLFLRPKKKAAQRARNEELLELLQRQEII